MSFVIVFLIIIMLLYAIQEKKIKAFPNWFDKTIVSLLPYLP